MSVKHTPGPWGFMGRNVGAHPEDALKWSGVASVSGYGPESDANLALIAAAPELLEALEQLRCVTINMDPDYKPSVAEVEASLKKARLTIAKAKGEAP